MRKLSRILAVLSSIGLAASAALGWSAHGHRTITYLALDGMPSESPEWMRDASIRNRIADQANEPDRWRGMQIPAIGHETYMDHYIDVEDLEQFGLTIDTVSPFRYEYMRDMAVALHVHPENAKPYDATKDDDKTKQWPGFLPHAITEEYNKLKLSFNTYRILVALNDPARADQLVMARENCIQHMGLLSHYVGDAAQPLHTTTHHHGWVGDNPNKYTADRGIHAYIDGTIVDLHQFTVDSLRPLMKYDAKVDAADPWKDTVTYIKRSHARVEPLYVMQRDKKLTEPEGKQFIAECLTDAAAQLSALYAAAWTSSEPDERQISAWVKYNNLKPELLPAGLPGDTARPSTGAGGGSEPVKPAPIPAPAQAPKSAEPAGKK